MADQDIPQIYLITPQLLEISEFGPQLATLLDNTEIACVRMAMETQDERQLSQTADQLREICHAREVPLVITHHLYLVERLGLDGVHFTDGARSIGKARKTLGEEAIVGAYCGTSRHDGMTAGELGADYVSFGPLQPSNLGHAEHAEDDLFAWWSDMVELPVVAEGGVDEDAIKRLAEVTDFFALGDELWNSDAPVAMLQSLISELQQAIVLSRSGE